MKIKYSFEKIILLLIGEIKIIKNKSGLLWISIIMIIVFIYICFHFFFKLVIIPNILVLKKDDKKFAKNISQNLENNFLLVKNAEGEPLTNANIIILNKIDYIPKISVII